MDTQALMGVVASLATDWFFVAVVFLLVAFDSLRAGSGRAIAISLSFISASFLSTLIPSTVFLEPIATRMGTGFPGLVIHLSLIGASYLVIRRMTSSYGDIGGEVLMSLFAALATTIMIVAFWITTPVFSVVWTFGPFFQSLFATSFALWWMVVALVILAVTRR